MTPTTTPTRLQRRYAVIGTGAIGGFYGAKLQQAGFDVHFLLNRDYQWVRDRGLVVESVNGDFTLPEVNAYQQPQKMPKCDVVIVALKTTANHLLPELLPPVVKENGVVVLLQNGLGAEEEVAQIVGSDRVMGGLCFICSNKIGPGHIRHSDYGAIELGDYDESYRARGITDRMQAIAGDFDRAGITILDSEDLLASRWKKLVWNIPFNGLSVILDAKTDALIADRATRSLAEDLMQEVVNGAAAHDRAIAPEFVQEMLDKTVKMKPYLTSMKLDYDRRQPLEIEAIFGNPLKKAAKVGVRLPKIETLYQQLVFLDRRNRR
ncbi:putative 2-dehydropantoate 2-reductase [Oxynema aestuarii]|uniref:2-dehydropantoate 2-reductase n=1 Tax=Oxynema aestuarii AP17 TaxID=2064643 RepID=A0A6H1TY60_9CYAN|nr:putative 2-dehydropantoate 2-reductase [Oxynema aestuarii]QIZ70299.1 putative 2-dehydropantoate 2-reductase [Oxynema aestuarii AP17]